jgi:hypothetical protein
VLSVEEAQTVGGKLGEGQQGKEKKEREKR